MRRGFTLVEVLVALAILGIIVAIVSGTFAGALRVQDAADRRTEVTHAARTALDRVTQDLRSAFVRQAQGNRPALAFAVEDREADGAARDLLSFATYGRPLGRAERVSDQALVQYDLVVSDDRRQRLLVRRQSDSLDPATLAEAPADVLAENVVGFDVKLYDSSGQRKDSWSDASLPRAVEITLRIVGPGADLRALAEAGAERRGDARTYGTRLVLPLAERK